MHTAAGTVAEVIYPVSTFHIMTEKDICPIAECTVHDEISAICVLFAE